MKIQLINTEGYITRLAGQWKIFSAVTLPVLLFLFLVPGLMLHAAHALASEQKSQPRMANHSFVFGGMGKPENPGVEILNFQYGDSKAPGTYVEDGRLATGHVRQGGMVNGTMPVGEFLYVKWRVLTTGRTYEDRVNLETRLPSDMDHKIIHFAVTGEQLSVNLIEGITSAQFHALGKPDCPALSFSLYKCTRIYPDHWANF